MTRTVGGLHDRRREQHIQPTCQRTRSIHNATTSRPYLGRFPCVLSMSLSWRHRRASSFDVSTVAMKIVAAMGASGLRKA
ncbi:hypothetical protein AB0383_08685 [Amycolatopsis sp. NPDC051373]|uniref:hypothetical protein n=1 Tax=Amycolatopsis sp. NPDC051373 TaxID=3155801 RepID=UPI0034506FB3